MVGPKYQRPPALAQVLRPVTRGQHQGNPAVALLTGVKQVQRVGDHARCLVLIERARTVVKEPSRVLVGVIPLDTGLAPEASEVAPY